jgi:hypothetical protein
MALSTGNMNIMAVMVVTTVGSGMTTMDSESSLEKTLRLLP